MHAKFLNSALIAVAGFAAVPTFAGQYLGGEVGAFAADSASVSSVSREQVRTEAVRSVQRGEMIGGLVLQQRRSVAAGTPATREAVRAEAARAVQDGLIVGGKV